MYYTRHKNFLHLSFQSLAWNNLTYSDDCNHSFLPQWNDHGLGQKCVPLFIHYYRARLLGFYIISCTYTLARIQRGPSGISSGIGFLLFFLSANFFLFLSTDFHAIPQTILNITFRSKPNYLLV